ncbi:MAG TPA: hypothetical protein VGW75_04490 [Solirubrobacteraceae bacterium]|jgi:hypothetical protein|nr:hypothetical protein [Solirubrobacteraceae bacterium]
MRTRASLAAAVAALAVGLPVATAQAGTDPANQIVTTKSFTLAPNATETFAVPIRGLGQDQNVLLPCYGFAIRGPGVELLGANLNPFGRVVPEPGHEQTSDGGVPGAERQADGSFVIPEEEAVVGPRAERMGVSCDAVGWRFLDDDGGARLDVDGNVVARGMTARAARRAKSRLRALRRRARARASSGSGPVSVVFAGIRNPADESALVVRVRTGDVPAGTKLTLHARVLPQRVDESRAR